MILPSGKNLVNNMTTGSTISPSMMSATNGLSATANSHSIGKG